MNTTIGGDRLGSDQKNIVETTHYNRSTHDLSYMWRSSAAAGTLIPFMSEIALPGDSWDIDLDCNVMTLPTLGPLFGSYKVQLDIFEVPIRLYQGKLHMNLLNIGMDMSQVKLPYINVGASYSATHDTDTQINPSCVLNYLGIRGVGRNYQQQQMDIYRKFNAVPFLAYYDIFKCYYANKQEPKAYIVHNNMALQNYALITSFQLKNDVLAYLGDLKVAQITGIAATTQLNALIVLDIGTDWIGQKPQVDLNYVFIVTNTATYSLAQLWDKFTYTWGNGNNGFTTTQLAIACNNYKLGGTRPTTFNLMGPGAKIEYTKYTMLNNAPKLESFDLVNIDKMRQNILAFVNSNNAFNVLTDGGNLSPYKQTLTKGNGGFPSRASQQGLAVKTYQSDLFNNWIQTEWITGANGISEVTQVDTSQGYFTIDNLNLASKVYSMLNQIAISGGSYDDWLDAVYTHERAKSIENPVYHGSLIKELSFEEVISTGTAQDEPLGTLAGRGRLTSKHKGGKIVIKTNEPSFIMGIVSLTPRIDYSQGNKWNTILENMNDFHKPALDQIAYQDLITDQMAYWDTVVIDNAGTQQPQYKSIGKQPAWINYMTNVNQTYGSFAQKDNSMYMTLNRRYEPAYTGGVTSGVKDFTTYIDPTKFNQIFAETALDAQNFWIQIRNQITCRRKMSAKQIPNL